MKKLLFLAFILTNIVGYAQTKRHQSCTVEIYLLKREVPDTVVQGLKGPFKIKMALLLDTAFIKDAEIISYRPGQAVGIKITPLAGERLQKLGISLSSGKQFALVVNGQIVYAGYFWNMISSFGCAWITAYAGKDFITIFKGMPASAFKSGNDNILENKALLNCLKLTNRLVE